VAANDQKWGAQEALAGNRASSKDVVIEKMRFKIDRFWRQLGCKYALQ
jgi:hypothetical protein